MPKDEIAKLQLELVEAQLEDEQLHARQAPLAELVRSHERIGLIRAELDRLSPEVPRLAQKGRYQKGVRMFPRHQ